MKLRDINKQYFSYQQGLTSIKDKSAAVQKLDASIGKDVESKDFVLQYLPERKAEEQILNSVSYLAVDNGVTLANIDVSEPVTSIPETKILTADSVIGTTPEANLLAPVEEVKFVSSNILVTGNYEKLKSFLSQIQKVKIFNQVKSVSIEQQQNVQEGGDPLLMKLAVDFGYLKKSKVTQQNLDAFNAQIDQNTIEKLKTYISQKVPGVNGEAKNRNNPFEM